MFLFIPHLPFLIDRQLGLKAAAVELDAGTDQVLFGGKCRFVLQVIAFHKVIVADELMFRVFVAIFNGFVLFMLMLMLMLRLGSRFMFVKSYMNAYE